MTIYARALQHFGKENQVRKLSEELAELQEAICKALDGRDTAVHVAEEIADVEIMLHQMMELFDISNIVVEQVKAAKLKRLKERIGE